MVFQDEFDIAIIGAGHAGVEAAAAAARLGARVALFTISLDSIANLPCNPSIGGTAKGHIVREIDALGGMMATAADANMIQSRMLNRGKGPAVHSLRAQMDRETYGLWVKHYLERFDNLQIKQAEIAEIITEGGKVAGVITALGVAYGAAAVIVATGTYLKGRVYVGEAAFDSGPDSALPAVALSASLERAGVSLRRFKTGTPARAKKSSIDFSQLEEQEADNPITPFSFFNEKPLENKVKCYIAYTNEETHRVIRENIHRSPLYSGLIEGVGPRYCPSIEDKIVRFAGKERHQIFVEPMGANTQEIYLQGMSSSLPVDVQLKFYRTIKGFENIEIMRNAYAIEYDCCDPTQLKPTLEFIGIKGLYGAGQFNGTSGYEEAAAQGLVAAINAVRTVRGQEKVIFERHNSYIGTLIDDLVTKGCNDPYRMMTSRSEYRLVLRQDNADTRLTPVGREVGLVDDERWAKFLQKRANVAAEIKRLSKTTAADLALMNTILVSRETSPLPNCIKLLELLKRPQISYADLAPLDPGRGQLSEQEIEQIEIQIKYEGYIKSQQSHIEQAARLESMKLPETLNYDDVEGLRLEAREKLKKIRPESLGQASRISGVNPADISILIVHFEKKKHRKEQSNDK